MNEEEIKQQAADILKSWRGERRGLIPVLQEIQAKFGYLPPEAMLQVAKFLRIPESSVYGVATFYSFLYTKPQGRHLIRVCKSLPCLIESSTSIIEHSSKELGIKPGETTADGRFSLELVNCIGACEKAPAMMVNHDVHGDLTPGKISQILEDYQ